MPRPSLRSSSFRKIRTRIPGGARVVKYFKRKPSRAVCAECGKALPGKSKSKSRPYGGSLCPACTKLRLKARSRGGE